MSWASFAGTGLSATTAALLADLLLFHAEDAAVASVNQFQNALTDRRGNIALFLYVWRTAHIVAGMQNVVLTCAVANGFP